MIELYTTKVKASTQKGQGIIADLRRCGDDSIYKAYDRPSYRKVRAFEEIKQRANGTEGYNHDLRICGHNCSTFSTVYSVSNADGTTSIIKDTVGNIYEVII